MHDFQKTMKKAGTILIVLGALDIAAMIYCVIANIGYSSSFNVLAVIAGVFLYRGNHRAAIYVPRGLALFIGMGVCLLAFFVPVIQPFRLWQVQLKLAPVTTLAEIVLTPVLILLLVWIYYLLRRPEVLDTLRANGRPTTRPYGWFIGGAAFAAFVGGMVGWMLSGSFADKAIAEAQSKYGTKYEYVVRHINWRSPGGGNAELVAFDDDEIKTVNVSWSDR